MAELPALPPSSLQERRFDIDQGLRNQGVFRDLMDATVQSLPYIGLDKLGDLLDPAPTHLDADYMTGGWRGYVQEPSERRLFAGMLNPDQADRMREDLDRRKLAMRGQEYDSMLYTFGLSLLPELLNPINYITGGAFAVTRAGTSTALRTMGSMARVSALTSAVEVGAISQLAPYIDDEELAEMFMTATVAGTVIGTGMSLGGRGLMRAARSAAPVTGHAARSLGERVRSYGRGADIDETGPVRETGESIIEYSDDGEVFVRPNNADEVVQDAFHPKGSAIRTSRGDDGKYRGWVWNAVRSMWEANPFIPARGVSAGLSSVSVTGVDGAVVPGAGLFHDITLPDGRTVTASKYAQDHLATLTALTEEKQSLPTLTVRSEDEGGGLQATWADGQTLTVRELRANEGAGLVGRIDQSFSTIPIDALPHVAERIVDREGFPTDLGLEQGGPVLHNFMVEWHKAFDLKEVTDLPIEQQGVRAKELASERVRASRASRDFLRDNWVSKLSLAFAPITQLSKPVRDNNYYMSTLHRLVGQFESMSAANAAGMESTPSIMMLAERHITGVGELMQHHASMYAEYQTGSSAGTGRLNQTVRNAASNTKTAARQMVSGMREGEMSFDEFGRAAMELYVADFNTSIPHPIYGVLPPQVEQLGRVIQKQFENMDVILRESGVTKSTGEMRNRINQLRREIAFQPDAEKLAEVTALEAKMNRLLEQPFSDPDFGNKYMPHMWRKDVVAAHPTEIINIIAVDHFQGREGMAPAEALEAATKFVRAWIADPDLNVDPTSLLPSASSTFGRKLRVDTKKLLAVTPERQVSFIEDDIGGVMLQYMRRTGVRVEMQRAFGEADATTRIEDVRQHLLASGISEKDTLHAERLMLLMRDRLMGAQHVLPYDHLARNSRRLVGNYVNAAVLGGGVITQLADGANMVARVGGVRVAKMLSEHISGNMPAIRNAAHGLQIAELMQWEMSTVARKYSEGDYTNLPRTSRLSGWSDRQMDKFFKANLMTGLNAIMKSAAVRFMNHGVIDDAFKAKRSSKARARLARLGFSPKDIENLRDLPHSKSQEGTYWPNYEEWTTPEGQALKAKLHNAGYAEAVNTIVTPGPLNRWQISEGIIGSDRKLASARAILQEKIDFEDASRELLTGHMADARRAGNYDNPDVTRDRNALREALQEAAADRRTTHQSLGKDSRIQNPATILLSLSTMLLTFPITSMTKITHALGSGTSAFPMQGVGSFLLIGMVIDYLKTPQWAWDEKEPEEKMVRALELSGMMGMYEQIHGIADKAGFGMRSALGVDIPFVEEGEEGQEIAQDVAGVGWSLVYGLADTLFNGNATTYEQARAIQRTLPLMGMIWWRDTLREITWALTNEDGEQ
jgi:hypothetical protein